MHCTNEYKEFFHCVCFQLSQLFLSSLSFKAGSHQSIFCERNEKAVGVTRGRSQRPLPFRAQGHQRRRRRRRGLQERVRGVSTAAVLFHKLGAVKIGQTRLLCIGKVHHISTSMATSKEPSIAELPKHILALIAMLGALLSLKQQRAGITSLHDIDDPNFVSISVALTFFGGSSIGAAYILEARPNSNWGKFMSRLTLLFGALTYIFVLVILVPAVEIPALLFWIICFVSFIGVSSYPYLKTLFTGAVGAFKNLQENVKNMIIARCFTSKPDEEEQSGHIQQIPGSVPAQIQPPMLESGRFLRCTSPGHQAGPCQKLNMVDLWH